MFDWFNQITANAPFTPSWFGVWLFAFLGGVASAFIVIDGIDSRLKYPFISKPIIGTTAGVAMCVLINNGQEPTSATLAFFAWVAAVCSTPIVSGFLVFISDQKRQNKLYKSAQDKFLPFGKDKGE